MTKVLYIPSGEYLIWVSKIPGQTFTVDVENAVLQTNNIKLLLDMMVEHQIVINAFTIIPTPFTIEEFEIFYD